MQLLDNAEATGLRFYSQQDALDFATKCVEDSKHWLSVHNLDVVKRYKQAELEIVVELLSAGSNSKKLHLIFCSVPDVRMGHAEVPADTMNTDVIASDSSTNRDDHFVLVCNAYFVECPEEIIASSVRLETAKERLDLWRDIFAPTENLGHPVQSWSKRESGVLGVLVPGSDGNCVPSVIESISEVLHQVRSDIANGSWKKLSQLDLVNLMSGFVRVRLDNCCVWIDSREIDNPPFKIGKVFLSPRNLAP